MFIFEIPFEVLAFGGVMLDLIMLVYGTDLDGIVADYQKRSCTNLHRRISTCQL